MKLNETPTNYSVNITTCSYSKWCYIISQKIEAFYIQGSLYMPLKSELHIQILMHGLFYITYNLQYVCKCYWLTLCRTFQF